MAISLSACGTLSPSTADTFCLAYEPVYFTAKGWSALAELEPRGYRATMRNNAKFLECPQ